MFKVFYDQVRFEKKNWQLLFENAIKKKKRGGNLNYKTHPVVLFSSVSVTKKKKGAEQRQFLRHQTTQFPRSRFGF